MSEGPALPELLQPLINARGLLKKREEDLRAELDVTRAELAVYEKVLKAAGLNTNGSEPMPKKPQSLPSERVQKLALDYVNTHGETDSVNLALAIDVSNSLAGKTLSYLRDEEKIRLLRYEAAAADGRGRKPIYGPWKEETRDRPSAGTVMHGDS